ncbi:MAG: methanogenesis marker 2 protein, partial [Methanosarcinaceae archaeon]|nr:methanogenesis marker 2 protein [Methanosarcinaceae archaeon]NKQ39694.1 methanogenesis marker 2 protein [Methanosarcinales archaeon]
MNLTELAFELKNYEGVSRKRPIADIVSIFKTVQPSLDSTIIDFGDDAAVIDIGNNSVMLFAADGIWDKLQKKSSWWAGYVAVLVNINDIAAMGGKPIAMVNIMSSKSNEDCKQMLEGIKEGISKFGVPMVGGHVHPDAPHNSISIAIIGIAKKDAIIRSDFAKEGDDIIVAIDLNGKFGSSPYAWDSTSFKDSDILKQQISVMQKIGEQGLATAGKDISNPGIIGTLGMLCESSGVGALVDIKKIPIPEGVNINQWLKVYPGIGYIISTNPTNSNKCLQLFNEVGITSSVVGSITSDLKLKIKNDEEKAIVFNFEVDCITGIV